ncbi:acyl carrier protein [Streptomyces sp. M19]
MLELVEARVAAVLGHGADERIDVERKLQDLGMDSMSAVGLRNQLAQVTGLRLPVSFVFEHPTPAEIARQLLKRIGSADPDAGASEPAGETISPRLRTPPGPAPCRRRCGGWWTPRATGRCSPRPPNCPTPTGGWRNWPPDPAG